MSQHPNLIADFKASLPETDPVQALSEGLIGDGAPVPGPNGVNPLIYADYVASGRALRQIEDFVTEQVLPFYANSHTEASFCGMMMTRTREQARQEIARICGGDARHAVIFSGSGATLGINRLVQLMGVKQAVEQGQNPLVVLGPYEHHSNILPWRESGAEIIEIDEAPTGGPDLTQLEAVLQSGQGRLIVGAFSAASNVTGIKTDVETVTTLFKKYQAKIIWDYAGGAPYLPIDMQIGMDAVVVSAHKFIGGPGASGVMILRRDSMAIDKPSLPGGGTVRFVSPWAEDYSTSIETREEAGTPNVVGDIRAALCFIVKEHISQSYLDSRLEALRHRAIKVWSQNPAIKILGNPEADDRLPIFSIQVKYLKRDGLVHHQLFTRMLSDYFGIQVRGGCACAGPYAHRLLDIDATHSETLRQAILSGAEIQKPGWTRIGFSALMSDQKADFIIDCVDRLARAPEDFDTVYDFDEKTARFSLAA